MERRDLSAKFFCLVYYYIAEDRDSLDSPNAYILDKDQDFVTLRDIRESFPMQGKFLFKFQYEVNK